MENKNLNREIILSKKVGLVDKYNFFEYISVMLEGGVSITESLDSVSSKISSPYFRLKLKELQTYITSGDSFSRAMRKIPSVFATSEVSVIESGETVGQLAKSFMKLSEDLKKIHELKNKIKGALTYPIIIILFLLLALSIVLTYVIPSVKTLFTNNDVELPLATKTLLFTSEFVINNIWLIILAIIAVVVLFIFYKNTKSGRENIGLFIFNIPLVGIIYRNYILSNIASTLGTLVGSGISIVKALTLTGKSTNNAVYERLFEEITEKVSRGEGIVKSIEEIDKKNKYFPLDYLQMLSVGEKTATLESVTARVSKQYEKEVDYSLARLTKWIEPLAILLAGIFVAWFAFAIFGAILKITDVVG